ncbi:MAG: polyphosphate kinase 2 family protein [Sphingobacteriaceae bacterium]
MENLTKKFGVFKNGKISLKDYDPAYTDSFNKENAADKLAELNEKMADFQDALYAANKYSLLIIFQAMDAAGKDSVIKHTMSGLNPQGCQVFSFKQPSAEEYDHDFLWRHYKALPERGRVGIHNRSHYENVLVCKVHPEYIFNERIPGVNDLSDIDADFWEKRYESIRNFEKHLHRNGTVVLKFFLHVSKDRQKERFLDRIEDPKKNWKFSSDDIKERQHWDDYMKAYEKAIGETATEDMPWFIIPADKKWYTRIAVSSIVLETLENLKLKYPVLSEEEISKLGESKNWLTDNE